MSEMATVMGVSNRAMFRRRVIATICSASLIMQTACYKVVPVDNNAPARPAALVTVDINERGRLIVGAKLGTLTEHVDGKIVRSDANEIEIAVTTAIDARADCIH